MNVCRISPSANHGQLKAESLNLVNSGNACIYVGNPCTSNTPNIRYNKNVLQWQYSNNGTSWSNIGSTSGSLNVGGDADILGNVWIHGNLYVSGSTVKVDENIYITSYLGVSGSSVLGDNENSDTVTVVGDLLLYNRLYVNYNGAPDDSYLYFYHNSSTTGACIKWNSGSSQFEFSDDVNVLGNITVSSSGSQFNTLTINNDLQVAGDIYLKDNKDFYLSSNTALYFNSGSNPTHVYFWFDEVNDRFHVNNNFFISSGGLCLAPDSLYLTTDAVIDKTLVISNENSGSSLNISIDGNIQVSSSGSQFNSLLVENDLQVGGELYLSNDSIIFDSGKTIKYDSGNSDFRFDDAITITGNNALTAYIGIFTNDVRVNGNNAYLNFTGPDADSYLYFYESGSYAGAYLKFDDADDRFEFNHDLSVSGSAKIGDGGTTNYCEIKDDGEINLHGTARVNRHVRVAAPSWQVGASAPTADFLDTFPVLKFDTSIDDEAHYSLIIPFSMVAGSTINVIVDWCFTGAPSADDVVWGLEYKCIKAGENPAGSNTTISGSSGGSHTVGQMVRTTIPTGITGAEAHDIVGLRLFRDVSEDSLGTDAQMLQVHFEFLSDKLGQPT